MSVNICLVRAADRDRLLNEPEFAHAIGDQGDSAEAVALGDRWQTMHFAITGEHWQPGSSPADPLGRAVLGHAGLEIPTTEAGYGPGRLLTHPEVRQVYEALSKLPTNLVAQRLLTAAGATPSSMHEAELLIGDEYELFDDLKDLYADAADEGCALLFTFG